VYNETVALLFVVRVSAELALILRALLHAACRACRAVLPDTRHSTSLFPVPKCMAR